MRPHRTDEHPAVPPGICLRACSPNQYLLHRTRIKLPKTIRTASTWRLTGRSLLKRSHPSSARNPSLTAGVVALLRRASARSTNPSRRPATAAPPRGDHEPSESGPKRQRRSIMASSAVPTLLHRSYAERLRSKSLPRVLAIDATQDPCPPRLNQAHILLALPRKALSRGP